MRSSALGVPSFRRLWIAGLISDSGDWLLFVALPLVVFRLSGSALGTAVAFLIELLPAVLLSPLVARIVDRYDRRRLMAAVNVLQAVALVPLLFVRTAEDLPLVYAVIAVQAALSSVFEPAKNALLPTLVGPDRVVSANALVGLNQDLGRLIGGPLGGVLLVIGDLGLLVAVDAVTYLLSAAIVASLPAVPRLAPEPGAVASGLLGAFRSLALRPWFAALFVSSVAQGLFVVLFVLFATDTLGGSDADVGLLRGIQAVGAIGAGLVVAVIAARARPRALVAIGGASFGVITLLIWNLPFATTQLWPYVALFALIGAPGVLLVSGLLSGVQQASDDRGRGSAFTALGVVSALGQAVGMLAAGLLVPVVGLLALLEVQGALYLLAGAIAVLGIRRAAAAAPVPS